MQVLILAATVVVLCVINYCRLRRQERVKKVNEFGPLGAGRGGLSRMP